MKKVYSRPKSLRPRPTGYCPGCLHGVVTRILTEIIDELNVADDVMAVLPIGCSTMGVLFFDTDCIVAPHGRAPAVATGVKRSDPKRVVFTYQGDGDLASIGLSEIMHAANRGENFVVVFVNNSTYGMTGGQMAPTTLIGQKSTTSQSGRDAATEGFPMHMCEIINQLKSPRIIARFSLDTPANIIKAKKMLKKSFELQLGEGGFCFIELLANCPTNLGMTALQSIEWMQKKLIPEFPVGVFRSPDEN